MTKKKSYSARLQVSLITFVILIIQILVFYAIFSRINILEMLESSTYKYYERRLEQGAERLENKMVNKWTSSRLMSPLLKELDYKYKINKEEGIALDFDKTISIALLEAMNNANVSGAFLLMNPDIYNEESKDEILFLRDTNSDFLINENSDIVVEMGSAKVAGDIGLTLSSSWSPYIKAQDSESSDINKIKKIVLDIYKKSGIRKQDKLGFWMSGMDLVGKGDKNIVYIEPIIDKYSYDLYGLLALEISDSMIFDTLEIDNMQKELGYGFALLETSKYDEYSHTTKSPVVYSFVDYIPFMLNKDIIEYNKITSVKHSDEHNADFDNIEYVEFKNYNFYALKYPVKLYDNDSYSAGNDWELALIVDKKNFTNNSEKYRQGLDVSIMFSIVLAIILAFILSYILTKPVKKLVQEIENMSLSSNKVEFNPYNITEMDLLTNKIEDLSENIASNYSRMQNLLEAIGYSIIVLEENAEKNTINKVGRISSLLSCAECEENIIEEYSKKEFKKVLRDYLRGRRLKFIDIKFETGMRVIRVENIATGERNYISCIEKYVDGRHFYIYSDYNRGYKDVIALEKEKNYDKLTSLINRNYFRKLVVDKLSKHPDKKYAMVMWDLDNLKYVNDRFGHDWGDSYLKETARVIGSFRGENIYVSRFSGDEFFAFMEYDGDKSEVRNKVQEIKEKLLNSELKISDLENMKIRASVGICWYPEDGINYDELYKFADFAMYRAKHTSKGSVMEFDRSIYDSEHIVISGREEFNRLVEEKLVKFAFQPIVSAKTGEIYAYEALMRTTSKSIRTVDQVLKIARIQFQLPQIETLTFQVVLGELTAREEEFGDKKIFINSIANVLVPENKRGDIKHCLEKWGDKIVIEITESEELDNYSMDVKKRYREEFGNMIAIDDFGSGYSSEKTLLNIKPDFIKIDMSIVRDIHKDQNRYHLVKNIIDYAKANGIKTIAEGIENKDELYVLMELGASFIQGYYLAKPNFDIIDIAEEKKAEILSIKEDIKEAR